MKLKVLVDNNTYIDQYYCGEPAVSYYIEDEDTSFLFDVGYSDLFIRNSNALGIDLQNISSIVISHGHDDHTRGLKYYFEQNHKNNISIIAHPNAFKEKMIGNLKICSPILEKELKEKCNLILSKEPKKISKHITFLGEIPELNDFENRKPIGKQIIGENSIDDYVIDDTALVYKSENGIYIITGCSHSGICNIIEYAKKVCKDNRVLGVIGGFHLFEVNEQVNKTIDYLKQNNVKELYPCHCTSFSVRAEIHKTLPLKEVGVGLELNW
ncbi:MBL fold metallo-hydrolase [Clostridium botulinum]|uniref:Metallo-beta-lactamase family protein n=2 Tax=Clostridium botulinum TaxID=1491 RepID=C1FK17_CLOBJ|nr:MBL fold metallo-hydrolase [Clostridium botulinum]ACO86608.1 metallo-beta-lactamase family protein [Clostridium botulinum A2 str. Kyoto]APH24354.1 metallo-beta-lactamase superfamily protein [Clostridium botulinum]APQ67188.1 metallo-beta-lactamase superfamily protein [Clostridium botulinum]AUN06240.1 MBL fold metallo-hydrolase [Clostridium botulinum]EPS53872.1 metallo-beta-lactamase family protein [Clostridium botulinum Af84]